MPSTNHSLHSSVVEPLLWSLKDTPPGPADEVIFEGQTTTTPAGSEEYTVSQPELPPEEQMTHWLTVESTHVVALENCR